MARVLYIHFISGNSICLLHSLINHLLDRLAKSKKSPIGYEPFVHETFKRKNILESRKYILKCEATARASLYLKIESIRDAAEAAYSLQDVAMLKTVRAATKNSTLLAEIDAMIEKLRWFDLILLYYMLRSCLQPPEINIHAMACFGKTNAFNKDTQVVVGRIK